MKAGKEQFSSSKKSGRSLFVLFTLSTDGMRAKQFGKTISVTQSSNSNANFIEKHPRLTSPDNV